MTYGEHFPTPIASSMSRRARYGGARMLRTGSMSRSSRTPWPERRTTPADGGLAALREAVATYAGDLLEDCYDDWLVARREQLRLRYLEALERLVTLLGGRGDHAQAIEFAERLIQKDPLNEQAYRLLMWLHAESGQRARALQTYHLCSATLERELGVEPSPATRAAYEAMLPAERSQPAPVEVLQAVPTGSSSLVGRAIRMDAFDDALARNPARSGPGRSPQR